MGFNTVATASIMTSVTIITFIEDIYNYYHWEDILGPQVFILYNKKVKLKPVEFLYLHLVVGVVTITGQFTIEFMNLVLTITDQCKDPTTVS